MLCNMSFVHFFRNCYNISTRMYKKKWSCSALILIFSNNKCDRVTLPLRNWLLFEVTSNGFVTFQIPVTSSCKGGQPGALYFL